MEKYNENQIQTVINDFRKTIYYIKCSAFEMETEYTLYANPKYVHISSDINDVPLEKLK